MLEKPPAVKHGRCGHSSAARSKSDAPAPKRKVRFADELVSTPPPVVNGTKPSRSRSDARPGAASQSKPVAPRGLSLPSDLIHPTGWRLSYSDQVFSCMQNNLHEGPSTLPTPGNLFMSPLPESPAISLPYPRSHSTDPNIQPLYLQGNLDGLAREVKGSISRAWAAHYERLHGKVMGMSQHLSDQLGTVDEQLNKYKGRMSEHEAFLASIKDGQQ
ncbi:hypothetical protein NW762_014267 [Fusarium torreyae]|uniref:Uncharacterized protein n=1 Tax=Fusarium torreyae TaxID=1237075 RepID=A0A9W8V802_9HYPO|nr:hypothetical protein NW762_014267 [Fusarium torreyae]